MKVNGKTFLLTKPQTLNEFLKRNNYDISKIVIELNGEIISKDKYNKIKIKNNDKLEILTFVGGG